MKFHCEKNLLTEAVMNVSRMIPSKSSIPALEGIKLVAQADGTLILTGYDMEAGITTNIPANVEEIGEIVLTARLFSDMIRKMSGNLVTVIVGDKFLTEIKCGITEFTILGIPAEEFPELPTVEQGTSINLALGNLKSMIDQTGFAIAVTDTKPVHMGSLFDISGNLLSVVSVDGYRLALRREKTESEIETKFVVPGKVLGEISKMIKEDSEETAAVCVSGRHIVFQIGNYSIISRLLEGEFLDYKNSIPAGFTSKVKVSKRELIDCIERASLLISDRLRSPLRIQFLQEGSIQINCSTSLGKFYDEIPCEMTGDTVEMGFNNKYLLDALRAADTDEINIEISGALSPIKIVPPEGDNFLFLVLPVRLKNEN